MKKQHKVVVIPFLLFCLLLPSCRPAQLADSTSISTITITHMPALTATSTTISMQTSTSVCTPNQKVKGVINNKLPGYIDILSVDSVLEGTNLTVTFILREIPNEITINQDFVVAHQPELAWGVAIDTDNNVHTGSSTHEYVANPGYGYDFTLEAFNYKEGTEQEGAIQSLFHDKTNVWMDQGGFSSIDETGVIKVDPKAKTIVISGNVKGITSVSYLYFYTYLQDSSTNELFDEICQR